MEWSCQERWLYKEVKTHPCKLRFTQFHIVSTVSIKAAITAIFPLALVVQLARKLALDLVLREDATEGEDAGLELAEDGETRVGEGSVSSGPRAVSRTVSRTQPSARVWVTLDSS